jgi:hypothetical protein
MAKKQGMKKPAAKVTRPTAKVAKPTSKPSVAKKQAKAPGKSPPRVKWLDDKSGAPLIEGYARRLSSFMNALADGKVEETEVKEQEERLVELMREVEPLLDAEQHAKVTELLCELTAYDIMQILNSLEQSRPKTEFRG